MAASVGGEVGSRSLRTTLATQLLFAFKLNPESVAFLGYADNAISERENPDPTVGLLRVDRTLFLKLSYAWRP